MRRQAARDAVAYIRRELPFGAQNLRHPHSARAEQTVEFSRDYMLKYDEGTVQKRIAIFKRFGAGNCMEMAYFAFDYLRKTRPADGVCLVQVGYHLTVCLGLFTVALNEAFNLRDAPHNVIFCDEWLAQWLRSERADGATGIQDADLTGVYGKTRFCDLIEEVGEDVRGSMVVRKRNVSRIDNDAEAVG